MTDATDTTIVIDRPAAAPPAGGRPRIRHVLRAAVDVYRHHFRAILTLGLVVLVPAALLDAFVSRLLEHTVDGQPWWAKTLVLTVVIVDFGAGAAALTFVAGVLDKIVGAHTKGHDLPTLRHVLRSVPWGRLVIVDLIVWGISALAALFFIIPGLVAFTLLSIAGPLVIMEDLRPFQAVRRSVHLIARHPVLAALLVTLPTFGEEAISDLLLESDLQHAGAALVLDLLLALVGTSAIGLLEVCLAHILVRNERETATAAAVGAAAAGTAPSPAT